MPTRQTTSGATMQALADQTSAVGRAYVRAKRYRRRPRVLPIGTISSGTLRMEDLIPALAGELSQLRLTRDERRTVREALAIDVDAMPALDADGGLGYIAAGDLYDDLCIIAEAHVPDYCYFGSLEGDGAHIGVWPSGELLAGYPMDGDVWRSADCPHPYTPDARGTCATCHGDCENSRTCGHWLYVNDHGNATLYRKAGRRWVEVWSVV